MSERLPVVAGKQLIKCLTSLDYVTTRQKGSHIRLEKKTGVGTHKITIPNHDPIAKGTLNDILNKVSIWNQIAKEALVEMLKHKV
jgi:predicted RNA binding protein YcfA (HicA-like mRNA interferase family)